MYVPKPLYLAWSKDGMDTRQYSLRKATFSEVLQQTFLHEDSADLSSSESDGDHVAV